MDRISRRIACCLVAVTFGILLPVVAHSEEVLSVQPQVAPAVESVQPQASLAGLAAPSVFSTCQPNYCGTNRQSVYLPWYYPGCTSGCGTETWYVRGLPPSLATYSIIPPTTTGTQRTQITFTIAATAPPGATGNIQLGANCSPRSSCTPATVSLTIKAPTPVNFQQVGPGVAMPDGVLHFNYSWDSTSGDLADLTACQVGENVMYPGSANPFPWPSPPYLGSTPNPTIIWLSATPGAFHDNHSHKPFLKPYKANAFNANQDYRYMCPSTGIVNFPGQTGITIARTVSDSTGRGCFGYTITKSGANASVKPLPGANCTRGSQRVSDFKNNSTEIGMSVAVPEVSVGLNAPIFFDLKVFNRTAKIVGLDLGSNRKANLEVTIWGPTGGVITRTLSLGGIGLSGEVSLAPHGAFVERLLLNEWYDFRQTGPYRIKVTLLDRSFAASGTGSVNRPSTQFSVQIGPRDPAQLKRVSQGLADRAIAGATLEEKMEAANALSYVLDPLAVESLVRVLQHGSMVEHYAVDGLGRIGSPEATAALVAAQYHPDEDVRTAVRSMLGVLQGRVQGPVGPVD